MEVWEELEIIVPHVSRKKNEMKNDLRTWFDYNGSDLVWKITRGRAKIGSVAGTINSRGYRHIRLYDKFYQAHRLVWIWHGKLLTDGDIIDHINRDRLDNRIDNLRVVSLSENSQNSDRCESYGVGAWKEGNKYVAWYRTGGQRFYVGRYSTQGEAITARDSYIANFKGM